MSEYIPLHEAWATLGREIASIIIPISKLPQNERIPALQSCLEDARKLTKKLLAQNHPDRGGDSAVFRRIQLAFQSIEYYTEKAKMRYEGKLQRDVERKSRQTVFITLDPK